MGPIKSLWASVQENPMVMRRANGWLTIFWIVMIPVSYVLGWLDSVTYVSALSLWALVSGHWSAWQAARVEVRQEEEIRHAAERDLPGEIVDRLVDETSVAPEPHRSSSAMSSTPSLDARRRSVAAPTAAAVATGLVGNPPCTCSCHAAPASL